MNETLMLIAIKERDHANQLATMAAERVLRNVNNGIDVHPEDIAQMVKAGGVAGRIEIMIEKTILPHS